MKALQVLIADFNCEIDGEVTSGLMDDYSLISLIGKPTCFKSDNPHCIIDLSVTIRIRNFQSSSVVETGLSDSHVVILAVLKGGFIKNGLKTIAYKDYRLFSTMHLKSDLTYTRIQEPTKSRDYGSFQAVVMDVLHKHAPAKKNSSRANDGPFMIKLCGKTSCKETNFVINITKKLLYKTIAQGHVGILQGYQFR